MRAHPQACARTRARERNAQQPRLQTTAAGGRIQATTSRQQGSFSQPPAHGTPTQRSGVGSIAARAQRKAFEATTGDGQRARPFFRSCARLASAIPVYRSVREPGNGGGVRRRGGRCNFRVSAFEPPRRRTRGSANWRRATFELPYTIDGGRRDVWSSWMTMQAYITPGTHPRKVRPSEIHIAGTPGAKGRGAVSGGAPYRTRRAAPLVARTEAALADHGRGRQD